MGEMLRADKEKLIKEIESLKAQLKAKNVKRPLPKDLSSLSIAQLEELNKDLQQRLGMDSKKMKKLDPEAFETMSDNELHALNKKLKNSGGDSSEDEATPKSQGKSGDASELGISKGKTAEASTHDAFNKRYASIRKEAQKVQKMKPGPKKEAELKS